MSFPGSSDETCEDRDYLCCDYFPDDGTETWYDTHVFEYNKIRMMDGLSD